MQRSCSRSARPNEYGSSSSSGRYESRSRSRSRSRSTSRRRAASPSPSRSRSRSESRSESHKPGTSSFLKGSVGLLAGIGIAAYAAHKIWPKGIIYGGKEEWETREAAAKKPNRRPLEYRRPRDEDALYERDASARRDARYMIRDGPRDELPQQRGRGMNRRSWAGPEERTITYEPPPRHMAPRSRGGRYGREEPDDNAYAIDRGANGWRR